MTTVNVLFQHDFSHDALGAITDMNFLHKSTSATATFSASQFDDRLSATMNITGNAQTNILVVNGGDIDASGWNFYRWDFAIDRIIFNGSDGNDVLTGNAYVSEIYGGIGNDTIYDFAIGGPSYSTASYGGQGDDIIHFLGRANTSYGGEGADTFLVDSSIENCRIVGGTGRDTVIFAAYGEVLLADVERVALGTISNTVVELQSAVNGILGGVTTIDGGTGHGNTVALSSVGTGDYRSLVFVNWASDNTIILQVGNINAYGSALAEVFSASGSEAAELYGGGGGDTFDLDYHPENYSIDGGAGLDRILVDIVSIRGQYQRDALYLDELFGLTSVEIIQFADSREFNDTPSSAQISAAQLANGITSIIGSVMQDTMTVQLFGLNVNCDASGVTLQKWNAAKDHLVIEGTLANNRIVGFDLASTLLGEAGNDTLIGGGGADSLFGGDGNDRIIGWAGNDRITGGNGNDLITGGAGKDLLTGGGEIDSFIFTTTTDSAKGTQRDVITDFEQGVDKINLSTIDAVTGGADNQFIFRGQDVFGPSAGLRFAHTATQTILYGDTNADHIADFEIALNGVFTLIATDFVL